jgi:hypothetical protein
MPNNNNNNNKMTIRVKSWHLALHYRLLGRLSLVALLSALGHLQCIIHGSFLRSLKESWQAKVASCCQVVCKCVMPSWNWKEIVEFEMDRWHWRDIHQLLVESCTSQGSELHSSLHLGSRASHSETPHSNHHTLRPNINIEEQNTKWRFSKSWCCSPGLPL